MCWLSKNWPQNKADKLLLPGSIYISISERDELLSSKNGTQRAQT